MTYHPLPIVTHKIGSSAPRNKLSLFSISKYFFCPDCKIGSTVLFAYRNRRKRKLIFFFGVYLGVSYHFPYYLFSVYSRKFRLKVSFVFPNPNLFFLSFLYNSKLSKLISPRKLNFF